MPMPDPLVRGFAAATAPAQTNSTRTSGSGRAVLTYIVGVWWAALRHLC
jgi:hypothetical protein